MPATIRAVRAALPAPRCAPELYARVRLLVGRQLLVLALIALQR